MHQDSITAACRCANLGRHSVRYGNSEKRHRDLSNRQTTIEGLKKHAANKPLTESRLTPAIVSDYKGTNPRQPMRINIGPKNIAQI
jgi:hypothetical protein